MSLPQIPLGGGDGGARVHFGYVSTAQGEKWHAWTAGPCHWYLCHPRRKTKPCLHWMTKGELECPLCSSPKKPEETGYLPLYREADGKPCMVVVHGYSREQVDALKLHDRTLIGRGLSENDGVYALRALSPTPRYQSTLTERMKPVDLTETLLRVWGIPELTDWYRRTHGAGDNTLSLPQGVAVKENGQPYGPEYQAAAKRAGALVVNDPATDEALNAIMKSLKDKMDRVPEPSRNGKPKPKG